MFDGRGSEQRRSPRSRLPQEAQMAPMLLGTKVIWGVSAYRCWALFPGARADLGLVATDV